jgi:hypothetical protein
LQFYRFCFWILSFFFLLKWERWLVSMPLLVPTGTLCLLYQQLYRYLFQILTSINPFASLLRQWYHREGVARFFFHSTKVPSSILAQSGAKTPNHDLSFFYCIYNVNYLNGFSSRWLGRELALQCHRVFEQGYPT